LPADAKEALAQLSERREVTSANRGAVSDDTVLTLATAQSIAALGFVSHADIERRFRHLDLRGGRQIEVLRASSSKLYIATSGLTNSAVLRAAAIGYFPRGQRPRRATL
jgi:ADP-ribosylglycohydrolase